MPPIPRTRTEDLDAAAALIQEHCKRHGVTLDDLTSRDSDRALDILHLIRAIRRRTGLPTNTIGAIFNLSLPETMALI